MQIIKTIILSCIFICICHALIVYVTQLLTPPLFQDITGVADKYKKMIDEYMTNAIEKEPSKRDYYETISYYVKKRLLPH